jgi:two-component system OmpR family sensor kinase
MLLVALLYYQNGKKLYLDLTKADMQNITSSISSNIILAHMQNTPFDNTKLLENNHYKISFYNEKKEQIFGNLNYKLNFSKGLIEYEDYHIFIDKSVSGHLGIYYIVIKDTRYIEKIKELKIGIIILFILIYSIISLIGYYLGKLFLIPIKEERKRLNTFIKDTTHELNTPISAIMMTTESVNLNEKQIQRLRLSARRVSEIYKDLTYTFLENNHNVKVINELDLDIVMKEQLEYFEPLAGKKKINISTNFENFKYMINEDDFIRVFNNLISNAIKYNKMNGNITISLKNKVLTIRDTGMGIQAKELKDIFSRYYRATTEQGGFGIGLNIVSRICKSYNINIEVHSTPKEYTNFILKF